jgi:hypothetical protein
MTTSESLPADEAFTVWVNRPGRGKVFLARRGAQIKRGSLATKTVTLTDYGDKSTGTVSKRELRFRTHEHKKDESPDYDEPDPKTTWWCEGDEVERVIAFLQSEVSKTGRYKLVDTSSPAGTILDLLRNGEFSAEDVTSILLQSEDTESLATLLSSSSQGAAIAQLAVIEERRAVLRDLRSLVNNPVSTETQIQNLIGQSYWIFGGRYVGVADRRNLIPLDQHDIPLLGADGTLHIVELKGPSIPRLVRRHRNHWIVGPEINEAVGQAMNYIRGLDEMGASVSKQYEDELGRSYGMRRVFATVVIGHPGHVTEKAPGGRRADERTIMDTIRSYNSHLSRVEVRTYKDLIDSAEQALNFENESTRSAAQSLAISTQSEETAKNSASSEEDPWAETLQAEDPWAGNLRAQNPQAEDPWAENPRAESTWAEEPPF